MKRGSLAVMLAALAAQGCSADRPAASPTAPPSPSRSMGSPAAEPAAAYPPQASPPSAPAGGAVPSAGATDAHPDAPAARELDKSERELAVAAGDCTTACRALGSMDRAAGHLCSLHGSTDAPRCTDAKTRVYSARAKVKSTCGSCPGGPSVESDAPIPSIR